MLALVGAAPLWFVPALIYVGLASGTAQAVINTYGTGLDTSAIIPRLNRVQATLVACALASSLVYVGHFYAALASGVSIFLAVLACSSIPWIVILTIGHVHRRGYDDVSDLQVFNRGEKGGVYWFTGGLNVVATGVWLLSVAAGLWFSHNQWFTSPGATWVGGLDVGFLVAGAVAAALYPLALRLFPEPAAVYGPNGTPRRGKRRWR